MMIRTITLAFLGLFFSLSNNLLAQNEQQAKKVLDKASSVIKATEGASAQFKISGANGFKNSGTIIIKNNMFHINTSQAMIWFNGKTQWTYLKANNEVNVSTPNASKQAIMNPYAFINMYKHGYKLSMKTIGNTHQVHLISTSSNASIKEMNISLNKVSSIISSAKILHNGNWLTINISNFKSKKISNATFVFNSKDFPSAEVIDLR